MAYTFGITWVYNGLHLVYYLVLDNTRDYQIVHGWYTDFDPTLTLLALSLNKLIVFSSAKLLRLLTRSKNLIKQDFIGVKPGKW